VCGTPVKSQDPPTSKPDTLIEVSDYPFEISDMPINLSKTDSNLSEIIDADHKFIRMLKDFFGSSDEKEV
jgi:hypothetical protein